MATLTVRVIVRRRWWLRWYLLGLWVCGQVSGLEPDPEKVGPWIRRGLYVQLER